MYVKEHLDFLPSFTLPPEETVTNKKEETVSFFKLFKFSSPLDVLLICVGTLTSLVSGIMLPYITILVGEVVGVIADYVGSVSEDKVLATEKLFSGTHHFVSVAAICSAVIIVCTYIAVVCFTYSSTRQTLKIRKLFFGKILDQDISWHEKNKSENFVNIIIRDISAIEDGIGEKIEVLLFIKASYLAGVIWACVSGWLFAMVCLALFPLKTILSTVLPRFWAKYGKKELEAYTSAYIVAKEILLSIKTVVAFGAEERESKRFNQYIKQARNHYFTACLFNGLNKALFCFLTYSCYGITFWYGIDLVIRDRSLPIAERVYTPGSMMSIYLVTLLTSRLYGGGGPEFEAIKKARAAAFKVFKILDSETTTRNGGKLPDFKSNIVFKNVNFSYPTNPDVEVLHDVTMKVSFGETIAIVGLPGSAKSAVIQLLQRIYDPTSGDISMDGVNLTDIDLNHLKKNVIVFSEKPSVFPAVTIADNIRYGNVSATLDDIVVAATKANVDRFISELPIGYQTIIDDKKYNISEVEKLKITLARALLKKPRLLILDETTTLLDVPNKSEVKKIMDSVLTLQEECTKIVITKRLSTLTKANRIIVFYDGKILEEGSHEELIETKGAYYKMIESGEITSLQNETKNERLEANKFYSMLCEDSKNKDEEFREDKNTLYLKIFKLGKPEWIFMIMGGLALLVNAALLSVWGLTLGNLMGALSIRDNTNFQAKAIIYCFDMLYLGVASGIAIFVQIVAMSYAGAKLSERVRVNMFITILQQEIGWFDRKENNFPALWSRLASDPKKMKIVGVRIYLILHLYLILLLAIVICLYLEWRLALIVGAFAPLIIFSAFYERKYAKTEVAFKANIGEKSSKIAEDAIQEILTVKALGCENVFYESYLTELLYSTTISFKRCHKKAVILGFARSLKFLAYAGAIAYGAQKLSQGKVDSAVIFQVLQVLLPSVTAIGLILSLLPDVQDGISAASRIFELLERAPAIKSYSNYVRQQWEYPNIEFSNVSFSYPTGVPLEVISGFNFSILHGKTVALFGGTDDRKSSILELLMRFYDPVKGKIMVDGNDLRYIDLRCLRSQMGIVSKNPTLFDLTIAENIAYGVNDRPVSVEEIEEAAKLANIHNFIVSLPLGYETRLGRTGQQLSSSQKLRLAFARVLIRNPKIILIDQITSMLDDASKKVIEEVFDKVRQGRTCIVVSQDRNIIEKSDLICFFKQSKLGRMVTHDELHAILEKPLSQLSN